MLYIVDLESVPSRYTCEWKEYLPPQLSKHIEDITVISGGDVPQATTPGAFLNFAGTNNYKSQQMLEISKLFANGKVKDGDYFLYTDAWNPTVIQLKYMAELLNIKITIGGMWHAGSYDPQDFLGRLIGDEPWVRFAEHSMYSCYDHNFFATKFHADIIADNLFDLDGIFNMSPGELLVSTDPTAKIVGWPMEYLKDILSQFNLPKKNKIIFPHRLAPEKQIEIFEDLAASMPEYEWFVAQRSKLTKDEYHTHLAESKMVFSANLQETLGISMIEGALVNAFPLMPDRLSYSEMWNNEYLYPSEWTESYDSYLANKEQLIQKIRNVMSQNNDYTASLAVETDKVLEQYFSGTELYSVIKQSIVDSAT